MTWKQTKNTTPLADEIDLIDIATIFWEGRRTLIKTIIVCVFAGVVIALVSPVQYTATMTMVPQAKDLNALGDLSGLASIAGINLNPSNASDITPALYPRVINSAPFQLELMRTKLSFGKIDHPITLYDYFANYYRPNPLIRYTIGLPALLLKAIRPPADEAQANDNDSLIALTETQREVQKALKEIILIEYDDEEGYVTLTCHMPEARPAAQLAKRTQELLQQYITEFKVQKSTAYFDFVQEHYNKAQDKYNQAQEKLARFRDENKNVSTAMAQTGLERLSNDYNLAFTLFSELARQLEQARMQVKEDTPVFTVIEPVSVPRERSKPRRTLILLIWAFLGGVGGTMIIFAKRFLQNMKESHRFKEKKEALGMPGEFP